MTAIHTILFDVDGTLLDTREFILQAFEHTLGASGLAVPGREELAAHVGLTTLHDFYAARTGGDAWALVEAHRVFQQANVALAVAFPGARETLAGLRSAGVRLAAVTSRSRRTTVPTLFHAGLAGYLDAVVSAEDASALKPDPAPFVRALELLGGAPGPGVAAVGDSTADVEAGRAIGLVTVAATYGFHGHRVLDAAPDHRLDHIADLAAVLGLGAWGLTPHGLE